MLYGARFHALMLLLLLMLSAGSAWPCADLLDPAALPWVFNTSNSEKATQYAEIFASLGVVATFSGVNVHEIDASPVEVVAHKASVLARDGAFVLTDDTSLDVDGVEIGINIKWMVGDLRNYVGRRATVRVLLAYARDGVVRIYQGSVRGRIVAPRGNGTPLYRYFLPEGRARTLAEEEPEALNPRLAAVRRLLADQPTAVIPAFTEWAGRWQPRE